MSKLDEASNVLYAPNSQTGLSMALHRAGKNLRRGLIINVNYQGLTVMLPKLKALFIGIPYIVGIETQTRCHRKCAYCPNSIIDRPFFEMPEDVFAGICATLASVGFTGELHLHGYGEPMLDDRLYTLVKSARSLLPESRVCVATSGDFLSPEKEADLVGAGVSSLLVTHHSNPSYQTTVRLSGAMKIEEGPIASTIYNRCGLIRLRGIKWRRLWVCTQIAFPWICATGDIAFCCHDYAARRGTGINVADPDWLTKWGSWRMRIDRLRAVFGPRPSACRGCKVSKLSVDSKWEIIKQGKKG